MLGLGFAGLGAERRKYSLNVKVKFVGYDTIEEAIERDIQKNRHDLDRVNEMEKAKKSLKNLVAPIYEGEIDGKKVIFKGKASFKPNSPSNRFVDKHSNGKVIHVNPDNYEDYIADTADAMYLMLIFTGVMFILTPIGMVMFPS